MPDERQSMGIGDWTVLLVLSVLWGGAFFLGKAALAEVPPFTVVWVRVTVAAGVLLLALGLSGNRLPTSPRAWLVYVVMGLLNNLIPFSLISWGQTRIASSLASILNAATPVWTAIFTHLLTRDERLTSYRAMGVALGLVGVVITIGPGALQTLGVNALAQLAVICGGVSYALGAIYSKRFSSDPPLVMATCQVSATAVMLTPIAALVDRPWTLSAPSWSTVAALAGLGTLGTAVAYLLFFRLLARAGANNVLLVTLLIPVTAMLLGTAFLAERLAPRQLLGMGVIGLGLASIDGRVFDVLRGRYAAARAGNAKRPEGQ